MNAEAGEMLSIGQLTHPAGCCQQCLGGNTTSIDAGAAHVSGLDDCHLQSVICSVFGRIESAITGTDHDHIEVETDVAHPGCCIKAVIVARRRSKRRGTAAEATFRDSIRAL